MLRYNANSQGLMSIGPLLWQRKQTVSAMCQLQPAIIGGRIGVNPGKLVLVYGGLNKQSRAKKSKHRLQAWNQLLPPVFTIQAPKNHEFVIKDVEKKGQETVPVLPQ